jgi:hypothetical protein
MKIIYVFLLLAFANLSLFAQQWQQETGTDRGRLQYYYNGNLGYSVRTSSGGGWAWQLVDGGNNNYFHVEYPTGNVGIGTATPSQKLEINGNLIENAENAALGIDAQLNARLGFIKKVGMGPVIASDNGNPIIFSQSNQIGIHTNIGVATVTERMRIDANGNIGIGTATPGSSYKLDVNGTINAAGILINGVPFAGGGSQWTTAGSNVYYSTTGNVGIGTSNPIEKLDVNGNINVPIGKTIGFAVNAGQGFTYDNNALGAYSIGWAFDNWADGRGSGGPTGNFSGWGGLKFFTGNQPRLSIDNSGNVGIGNTAPDAKLTVSGQVHAQEVKVTVNAPGPDYVFEKDYKLSSLEEIKNYIDQNKHLPEVPSAKEMEKNGVQLGEMNMLLLKKIEELTLYQIQSLERIKKLEDEIIKLKNNNHE